MNLHLRQTGRTERMLAEASSLVAQGYAVYIYAHHHTFVRHLQEKARRFGTLSSAKIEVLPEGFNWSTMRAHENMHPKCICLVDHLAVEIYLQELDERILKLQQLARQLYPLTT